MDGKVSTVFIGIGGYGDLYPSLIERFPEIREICRPVGVVDPFAGRAPHCGWFREQGVPFYDTAEAFYKERAAELAVIATPIPYHKPQCLAALQNGSHVLCEKPLVPSLSDALELEKAAGAAGRTLGVGFQWSFSRSMNRLKRDVLEGRFGRPFCLKSLICWKRGYDYYESSGWKGRFFDAAGRLVRDSVVTNATAHYLHNIFFLLGTTPDGAAMPEWVDAQVYRAKDIESFDTCALKGTFRDGAAFWYGATHAGDLDDETRFRYAFEKGDIHFNDRPGDPRDHMIAVFKSGEVLDYGNPQATDESAPKFLTMLRRCRDEKAAVPCTPATAKPHLAVCEGLFDKAAVGGFPADRVFEGAKPDGSCKGIYVRGLSELLIRGYETGKLPCEIKDAALEMREHVRFQPGEGDKSCASV